MCGYLVKFSKNDINKQIFESSLENFVHRGPDNKGLLHTSDQILKLNYSMGFQRLSIFDLSSDANQPMKDNSGKLVITFNGEIYNNAELRSFLIKKNFKFNTSHSDTETILKAYQYFGDNVSEQLEGQFSFVIFDKVNNKLLISRDRLGQKPLYYYLNHEEIIFSSSLKSVVENTEHKVKLSYQNLFNFMQLGNIPSPATPYEQIFKLFHFIIL